MSRSRLWGTRRRFLLASGLLLFGQIMAACGAAPGHPAARATKPPAPTATPGTVVTSRPAQIVQPGLVTVHVPILMYHYIGSVPKNDPNPGLRAGLTVSPEAFTQQMDYLAANGYHPIDMTTLRGYFAGGTLPAKPVVVTLDDGTADLYTQAYPVLQAHHFKAVAYIISGFINASGRVTSQQILEMESGGIEIAAHTWNHLDLTTLSADRVQFELVRCKQDLEKLVGHPVLDFAYPAGRFNPAVVNQVLQAGYQSAVTTDWGATHTVADKLTWTRIRVDGGEPLEQFIANLGPTDPIVTAHVVATPSPPTVHPAP